MLKYLVCVSEYTVCVHIFYTRIVVLLNSIHEIDLKQKKKKLRFPKNQTHAGTYVVHLYQTRMVITVQCIVKRPCEEHFPAKIRYIM